MEFQGCRPNGARGGGVEQPEGNSHGDYGYDGIWGGMGILTDEGSRAEIPYRRARAPVRPLQRSRHAWLRSRRFRVDAGAGEGFAFGIRFTFDAPAHDHDHPFAMQGPGGGIPRNIWHFWMWMNHRLLDSV